MGDECASMGRYFISFWNPRSLSDNDNADTNSVWVGICRYAHEMLSGKHYIEKFVFRYTLGTVVYVISKTT